MVKGTKQGKLTGIGIIVVQTLGRWAGLYTASEAKRVINWDVPGWSWLERSGGGCRERGELYQGRSMGTAAYRLLDNSG